MSIIHTTLKEAIEKGDLAKIKVYKQKNGSFEEKLKRVPSHFSTALTYAFFHYQYEAMKLLLELGVDPNEKTDEGRTPFYLAMCNGDYEAAKILIKYGADLDESDIEFVLEGEKKLNCFLLYTEEWKEILEGTEVYKKLKGLRLNKIFSEGK